MLGGLSLATSANSGADTSTGPQGSVFSGPNLSGPTFGNYAAAGATQTNTALPKWALPAVAAVVAILLLKR